MQTIFEDNDKIFQSILAGASGYIFKNTSPQEFLNLSKKLMKAAHP